MSASSHSIPNALSTAYHESESPESFPSMPRPQYMPQNFPSVSQASLMPSVQFRSQPSPFIPFQNMEMQPSYMHPFHPPTNGQQESSLSVVLPLLLQLLPLLTSSQTTTQPSIKNVPDHALDSSMVDLLGKLPDDYKPILAALENKGSLDHSTLLKFMLLKHLMDDKKKEKETKESSNQGNAAFPFMNPLLGDKNFHQLVDNFFKHHQRMLMLQMLSNAAGSTMTRSSPVAAQMNPLANLLGMNGLMNPFQSMQIQPQTYYPYSYPEPSRPRRRGRKSRSRRRRKSRSSRSRKSKSRRSRSSKPPPPPSI